MATVLSTISVDTLEDLAITESSALRAFLAPLEIGLNLTTSTKTYNGCLSPDSQVSRFRELMLTLKPTLEHRPRRRQRRVSGISDTTRLSNDLGPDQWVGHNQIVALALTEACCKHGLARFIPTSEGLSLSYPFCVGSGWKVNADTLNVPSFPTSAK